MKSTAIPKPSEATINRLSLAGAFLLAAYFLATSLYIATHRLFWYDEVFTTLTVRMPDWHTIWRALVDANADPTPFGFFVVARVFDKLFGPAEIGIRLPSALAMIGGMWFTYDCARRLTNRLHGLIAMALLTCTFLPYYGYEGRCYALFFLFASAVLWTWTGRRSAILLGALFFFGTLIHYYLVLCLIPFAAEELWQSRPWRWPSARLISGGIGACAGIAALYPQIVSSKHAHGETWWAAPKIRDIASVFTDIFPAGLLLLAVVTIWIVCFDRSKGVPVPPPSTAERTAWFFLAIPLVGFVLAVLVTHAYLHRYFIGMLPGVAVGFSCLVYRRFPNALLVPAGVLAILAGYGIVNQAIAVAHWDKINEYGPSHERVRDLMAMEDQLWALGAHYLVFHDYDLRYLEMRYYSKHPERYACWLKKKPPVSKYYPMQMWDIEDVKRHSGEMMLISFGQPWIETLQKAGLHPRMWETNDFFFTYFE
jgi:hypothetical protein